MAIYRTAIRKAVAGDFKFTKMLFEIQGEYKQRSETKVTRVYDEYDDKTDEEIIEEIERELKIYKAIKEKRTGNGKDKETRD